MKWNNGMVEGWNIGFQKDINHFYFIVNPAGGGTINPTLHYPLQAAGQNPLFHFSSIPIGAKPLSTIFIVIPAQAGIQKNGKIRLFTKPFLFTIKNLVLWASGS
jgi:hypothetical protein